jgi:hypothetical protein
LVKHVLKYIGPVTPTVKYLLKSFRERSNDYWGALLVTSSRASAGHIVTVAEIALRT